MLEDDVQHILPIRQNSQNQISTPLRIRYNGAVIETKEAFDMDSLRNIFRLLNEYF